jgi:hypothetical protein
MRWLLSVAVGVVVAGCGGRQERQKPALPAAQTTCVEGVNCSGTPKTYRHCTSVSRGFRACTTIPPNGRERSRIERRADSGWVTVLRAQDAPAHGWWRRAIGSPDRSTILGQLSGDCEVQTTYIIRVGSKPRLVFAQAESFAVGWSRDGLARVLVTAAAPDPRGDVRPGIYRVDPRTLAHTLERWRGEGPHC